MRVDYRATPQEQTDSAAQKDNVITFLETASPSDIDAKVEQIFTNAASPEEAVKTILKTQLKWMAWVTRKINNR